MSQKTITDEAVVRTYSNPKVETRNPEFEFEPTRALLLATGHVECQYADNEGGMIWAQLLPEARVVEISNETGGV